MWKKKRYEKIRWKQKKTNIGKSRYLPFLGGRKGPTARNHAKLTPLKVYLDHKTIQKCKIYNMLNKVKQNIMLWNQTSNRNMSNIMSQYVKHHVTHHVTSQYVKQSKTEYHVTHYEIKHHVTICQTSCHIISHHVKHHITIHHVTSCHTSYHTVKSWNANTAGNVYIKSRKQKERKL